MDARRLVTVGQLTVDTTVLLDAPVAVAVGDQTTGRALRSFGGTAAIAARNAAIATRVPTKFCGHVGDDPAGRAARMDLAMAGVELGDLLVTAASPEVLVLVDPAGERTMVASPGRPAWERLETRVGPGDIVLFEGWHLFAPGPYSDLVRGARAAGAFVAIDVCSATRADDPVRHGRFLADLRPHLVLANAAEAEAYGLTHRAASRETAVVVHAGSDPTQAWWGGVELTVPVAVGPVTDTTGAGDTFAGTLLGALILGSSLREAIEAAHAAAANVVGRIGPHLPVTSEEGASVLLHAHASVHADP